MKRSDQSTKQHKRRWPWLVLILVVFLTVGYGLNWLDQPKTSQPPHSNQQLRLVAVGDSLTQGIGYGNQQQGYLPLLKAYMKQRYSVQLTAKNFGVGGLRSDQIDRRIQDSNPIQSAIKKADIVSITVGGNDLLQTLQKNLTVETQTELTKRLAQPKIDYQEKLSRLITRVQKLRPNAQIFLFGLYNPVYVYFSRAKPITQAVDDWDRVNQETANNFKKVSYVSINDKLSHGQYQTAQQRASLAQDDRKIAEALSEATTASDVLAKLPSGEKNAYLSAEDHFHPNLKGYRYMALKLMDKIAQTLHLKTK